jgi:hypothetical protein
MILVVSNEQDEHARAVIAEIAAAGGHAQLLDLSEVPERLGLMMLFEDGRRSFRFGTGEGLPARDIDFADCRAIWWRRPQTPLISEAITRPTHRLFAMSEVHEALAGLWHAVDAFWINDPARDQLAHRKVYQLRVAQEVGLTIPRTLITSDPETARRFVEEQGPERTIFKAFTASEEEWRETRLIGPAELAALDNVRYAPVTFQEYVEAVHDLRVTVVGDRIFPAAIHSQETAYKVDFRMDIANARIDATELPDDVEAALGRLMRRLGLVYGAIDMRLTPDGRHVFLEINPAGQWLFVEQLTGQPIAAELARLLLAHDQPAGTRAAVAAG